MHVCYKHTQTYINISQYTHTYIYSLITYRVHLVHISRCSDNCEIFFSFHSLSAEINISHIASSVSCVFKKKKKKYQKTSYKIV